jgi:hypothetical protein
MGTPHFEEGGLGGGVGPLTCPPVGTWARPSMTILAAFAALIWVVLTPERPY